MKKIIITCLACGLVACGLYQFRSYAKTVKDSHCLTTQISSRLFDFNSFEVVVPEQISLQEIKVACKDNGKIIFQDGIASTGIDNHYGQTAFLVYYRNKLLAEIGHFKKNNWETYEYVLSIQSDKSKALTLNLTDKNKVLFTPYTTYH